MPLYSASLSFAAGIASAAPICNLKGVTRRGFLRRIKVTQDASANPSAMKIGLYRPNNTPVSTATTVPVPNDPADAASTVVVETAWSTAPTIGANVALDLWTIAPSVGSGTIEPYSRDEEIVIPIGGWLTVWNASAIATPAFTLKLAYEE